jgi:Asp-tRNA(Asn)/Glu-tRNA(Gln) amidotransferase A subunit family amidase
MQLMGRHFQEPLLFQAAHAYQQVTTWHWQIPPL